MDKIILSGGIEKREIDAERTASRYYTLVSNFIESELFAANPLDMTEAELDAFAARRTNNPGGYSWLESTGKFYSRCHLAKVLHINDPIPWDQLSFQPWKNFPVVTLNRFRREAPVYLANAHELLPLRKKYEVLGAVDDTTEIRYFTNRVETPFLYCYKFSILDDFNRHRSCLRFAEDQFKREALLLTQHFTINYFLSHPYECLPLPYLADGSGWVINDIPAMRQIMEPIFREKKESLESLDDMFIDQLRSQNLRPEII